MNPAALSLHSWYRKSIAFFNAPLAPWLYSGVTKTYPSKDATAMDHARVCSWVYWSENGRPASNNIAGSGSSSSGRLKSATSSTSKSASSRLRAMAYAHSPTPLAFPPGRVLPMTIAIFSDRFCAVDIGPLPVSPSGTCARRRSRSVLQRSIEVNGCVRAIAERLVVRVTAATERHLVGVRDFAAVDVRELDWA